MADRCERVNVFAGVVVGYYWNGIGIQPADTKSASAPIDARFPAGSPISLFDVVRTPGETGVRNSGQPELEYTAADAAMNPGSDYVVAAYLFERPGPYQWLIGSGNESVRPWNNGVIEATPGTTKVPSAEDEFQAALVRKREEVERSRSTVPPEDSFGPQPGVDDQGCVKPIDDKGQLENDAPCLEIDPSTHRPKGEPPPLPDPNAPNASTTTSK
jgi:hypothetical protein